MKLEDVSVSKKLWISNVALLLAMLAVGVWGQYRIHRADGIAAARLQHHEELIGLMSAWQAMARGNTHAVVGSVVSNGANQGAVREALSRLASEGLVTAEPQRGFRARPISRAELLDLTHVRIGIEGQCLVRAIAVGDERWEQALQAAYRELSSTPEKSLAGDARHPRPRMTEPWSQRHGRYHEALVAACDSPWLLRLRAQLYAQAERYRRLSVPLQHARRDVDAEHHALLEAALARDTRRACGLMAEHFEKTAQILLNALAFDDDATAAP